MAQDVPKSLKNKVPTELQRSECQRKQNCEFCD